MDLDFTSASFASDPYRTYRELRRSAPVLWDDDTMTWYVARYDDVFKLLVDDALGARGVPPGWQTSRPTTGR